MFRLLFVTVLFSMLCCFPAGAAESVDREDEDSDEHHKNVLAGFVGLTHERREDGLALGFEYQRRLTKNVGVTVLAERTWGDFDFWVVAVPVHFRAKRWRFGIGPGIERKQGGNTEGLIRVAIGYAFEAEHVHYAPALSVDFVDGEQVYVLGIGVGFSF